jgi:hypothetical protein
MGAVLPNFYLFNTLVNPPQNWQEMTLELNFDKDNSVNRARVGITDWDFVLENSKLINQHIIDGLTTGVGVLEGIPFRVEIERQGDLEVLFNGYLDLIQSSSLTRNITSNVKAVELYSPDWLNDKADSFTFAYLYKEIGSITDSDFINVPYILSSIPNYLNAAVATLGVYVMAKEVKDAIQRIVEFVADLPVYYVFSTYIKLILYIIYLIFVIIALIKLVRDIILLLIQPVKYHAGMKVSTMLQKGCEYLGMEFDSPLFAAGGVYENLVIIPQKYYVPINNKNEKILGITEPKIAQEGYYKGTFGQLVRDIKELINGKVIIDGNKMMLVRSDYNDSTNLYTLPAIDNPYFTLNANEFESNTYITFQTDLSDSNTIHDYLGTAYQVINQPERINNQAMVLMKGLNEVRIPFALAKIKTDLTTPEKILDVFVKTVGKILGALVKAVNAVIKVLNTIINIVNSILKKLATIGIKLNFKLPNIPTINPPNFSDTFSNRKGMMKIENDIFNVAKIVDLDIQNDAKRTKISSDNVTILSAKYLYDNFYYINGFLPTSDRPNANQFYLKNYDKVPFIFQDYKKIKKNNRIFTSEGESALIDSLKWNPFKQTAQINIRISKLYTNNLRLTTIEPDGR